MGSLGRFYELPEEEEDSHLDESQSLHINQNNNSDNFLNDRELESYLERSSFGELDSEDLERRRLIVITDV